MSIASTVDFALTLTDVDFQILKHAHASSSAESAHRAHIAEEQLAKAVALKDELGPLLAVIPASHRLDIESLRSMLRRPQLDLMSEEEIGRVFFDCETGAVPPLGPDYRVPTIVDRVLMKMDDIYFEAGDHRDLVHVDRTSFRKLMRGVEFTRISNPIQQT